MNETIVNLTQSEEAPRFEIEHPVLVEVKFKRRSGGNPPLEALEGFFDASALLALEPGQEIQGKGWMDVAIWVQLAEEYTTEFAEVIDGTVTCLTEDLRVVFRDGKAIQIQGKTIYQEQNEVLCPFCQGIVKPVRGGFIEIGDWNGQYELEGNLDGYLCQASCRAYFFTGFTSTDLEKVQHKSP